MEIARVPFLLIEGQMVRPQDGNELVVTEQPISKTETRSKPDPRGAPSQPGPVTV